MKKLLFFLVLVSSNTLAIGPSSFEIKDFFTDAKFIGVVKIESGQASNEFKGYDSCSATYSAKVVESIVGVDKGETISLHHLIDYRDPPFEIGSRYFVYAESRDTHSFINLGDAIDLSLDDPRPKSCHSDHSLYIYREFSHKVHSDRGFSWIDSMDLRAWSGIRQINEIRNKASRVYYSFDYLPEMYAIGKPGRDNKNIRGEGLEYNSVIKLFRKYKQKYYKATGINALTKQSTGLR